MEHLIEEIVWLQDKGWLRGFIFGLVHTIIPLIGFYSGWSINRMLKIISNGYIAGIIGVVFAHVIADYIAATLDPNLRSAAIGIVLGGLVPLVLIPFLDKLSKDAADIGAVNTIEIKGEKFIGHNTDFFGFTQSIIPILKERRNALILGNAAASKY